jgi:hypothetical protein
MQGKLVERVQIPVKHGAIGQSFPALARNYGTAALTQERLPVFLFEFRA